MNNAPVLVLQMQRMGDLVLSFPLLAWLKVVFPDRPVWVIGEELFFTPLLSLSPNVSYFSYECAPDVSQTRFHAVINLSHRPEAASLAGKAKSDTLIGPWLDTKGNLFINGDWQLYRASLTHNNRYNLYHWSDLNALDIVPTHVMQSTFHPAAKELPGSPAIFFASPASSRGNDAKSMPSGVESARIGLFLGASEPEKRPEVDFWAGLATALMRAGHKPVLLGGPAERQLGASVATIIGSHSLNLTGHFNVSALAHFLSKLDLLITPDTGPMHVASWIGTPVLNLSMGPVNPWETGPSSPGHHVLRAVLECDGCWRCTREEALCRNRITQANAAAVASLLLAAPGVNYTERLARATEGLELFTTARDHYGLAILEPFFPRTGVASFQNGRPKHPSITVGNTARLSFEAMARPALSAFWKAWFGAQLGRFAPDTYLCEWETLKTEYPKAAQSLADGGATYALSLVKTFRSRPAELLASPDFWKEAHPFVRPLSGYVQMYAQNKAGSREAFMHILSLVEQIAALQ